MVDGHHQCLKTIDDQGKDRAAVFFHSNRQADRPSATEKILRGKNSNSEDNLWLHDLDFVPDNIPAVVSFRLAWGPVHWGLAVTDVRRERVLRPVQAHCRYQLVQ